VVGLQTLVVVLHLGSLMRPHIEGDEAVFVLLAERRRVDPLAYNLQGALDGAAARRFIDDVWVPRFVVPGDPSADELRRFFARMPTAAVLLQPLSGNTAFVANRPWHFYVTGLVLTAPLVVVAPLGAVAARTSRRLVVPVAWAVAFVVAVWTLGALGWGGGFQLRYLAPAAPATALLVGAGVLRVGRPMCVVVAALALVTFFSGWATSRIGEAADPAPMALGLGLPYVGTSLRELLPGFW
jgi:hypothetical protein